MTSEPKLFPEDRRRIHRQLVECQIVYSCLNCEHFQQIEERVCELYKVEPPPEVIVFGCPSWVPEIPF